MTELVEVTVERGKYTLRQTEPGKWEALRHGEPWPAFADKQPDNLHVALALEVDRLRASEERPHLRDCPMCHADGSNDEKVYLTKEVMIANGVEYPTSYCVRCVECGASVGDEYKEEAVRLWNGEEKREEDDE